jgi:uncharacterized protein YqeY
MSDPRQRIETDLRAARKAGERERVATLGMLLTAIDNERIRGGEPVDDTAFATLVQKAIKQRKEASEQYRQGGSDERAQSEEREAEILAVYLPEQVDEEELRQAILEIVDAGALSGPAGIGRVMGQMMARYRGRADGGTINRLAREILGG